MQTMIRRLIAVLVAIVSATSVTHGVLAQDSLMTVTIATGLTGQVAASIPVRMTEPYVVGPFAGTSAREAVSERPALTFGIRSWKEGQSARVVVYAVLDDPRVPQGHSETPIATFTLRRGRHVWVNEVTKWGEPPMVVSAQ
jgi:hypothetical protein